MKKMPSGSYLIQFIDVAAHKDTTVKLLRSTTSLSRHQMNGEVFTTELSNA